MQLIKTTTKTLVSRDNGRSADCISPNFIYGCLGGCMKSYCYVGRFNPDTVRVNQNLTEILSSLDGWVENQPWPKQPNQTDPIYYTADIGCSTDVALMHKHYDWQKVFDYFNAHPRYKSTFATKYPTRFPMYNIDSKKNRIRVSLMPQKYSSVLESNTDSIIDRVFSIKELQKRMEVHINFSPIIYTEGWLKEYKDLFELLSSHDINLPCEAIFLTYNLKQFNRNSDEVNKLCFRPEFQEPKDSQYAPDNIRYKRDLKSRMVMVWTSLYGKYFPTKNIRYIF